MRCASCKTREARPDRKSCGFCATRARGYHKKRAAHGKCSRCIQPRAPGHSVCEAHRQARLAAHRALKAEALRAYGGHCACCREAGADFLTIDHVMEDGARHRREIFGAKDRGGCGVHFYRWLKKNGFPGGFQVLCFNCNFSKHQGGGVCMHARGA